MKYEMTKELATTWVEALRSGKYQQCRSALKNDEGFCCLGVLADILEPDNWVLTKQDDTQVIHPLQMADGDGFLDEDKVGIPAEIQSRYAGLNDDFISFATIAVTIEQDYKLTTKENTGNE